MTKRTEAQQRKLELKSSIMSWVANKLFSFKQTGVDGFIKRRLLKPKRPAAKPAEESSAGHRQLREERTTT